MGSKIQEIKYIPELDTEFYPAAVFNRAYKKNVEESTRQEPLKIALEREDGMISVIDTFVLSSDPEPDEMTLQYVERLVKALLWIRGGWKIMISGPDKICRYIKECYTDNGIRAFDAKFMGKIYERPFEVEIRRSEDTPKANEKPAPIGKHFNGCRIGLDLGGSDRKVAAVVDGNAVYTEEVEWHPKISSDPGYHYHGIVEALKTAASKMDRVDGIGVSSAGIYKNNRVMAASLFISISDKDFDNKVKGIIIEAAQKIGDVPLVVANDGDVTALAGAMEIGENGILGIALGTSEAGGYVNKDGYITGWLNELAFVPVDYNPDSPVDEWSGDVGCGVKYFSQDAVIRLAKKAGIQLDESLSLAQKLKSVQSLLQKEDKRAVKIFETIGIYLGYTIALYSDFYDIRHILILGRVTSGNGGHIIMDNCSRVLENEFPELFKTIKMHLPDEANRRTGQAVAAASLPVIQ